MVFTDGRSRPLDPQLVSWATAYGITPRVFSTWSPVMHRAPRVLVPMVLDVLVVRDANQSWAECAMQPPATGDHDNPVHAADLMPAPFADLATPRARGAYLHWYLPNALTSGISDTDTNTATFPQIPDRWLVLRLSTGNNDARRAVRGWILDAGGETPHVIDLDAWIEHGTPPAVEKPLTALGHGDLSWAGYFDNVVNRLGFFDGTLDAVSGPLAYVVCGWYSDPSADPLGDAQITTSSAFDAKLQELGWHVDQSELDKVHREAMKYVNAASNLGFQFSSARVLQSVPPPVDLPAGKWWPQAVLLHGAVVGISWPAGTSAAEVGGPPPAASISVAVGNSTAEAIAMLVARANNAPQQAAIIEALQLGVIRELEQPDGRAQLDIALHASSFASLPGGPDTLEPLHIAPSGPPPAPPANSHPPKPGVFGASASAASETVNFSRFVERTSAASAQRNFQTAAFSRATLGEANVWSGVSRAARAEQSVLLGGMAEVIQNLGLASDVPESDPGGTVEARRAQPRFYTPKDPIVLVQGAKRAFVHDSSVHTDDGMLNCRLTAIGELSWLMPISGERFSVKGDDVLERGVENGSVPRECEAILRETVLLDPGSASAAAASAAGTAGLASRVTGPVAGAPIRFDRNAAQQNIAVEQTAWWALRDPGVDHGPLLAQSGLAGTLPAAFAIAPAARPWAPMHLDWAVEFVPSPNGVSDWTLDEIDFSLNSTAAIPPAGGGMRFEGRAVLTPGASTTLAASIRNTLTQVASIGGTGAVHPTAREAFYSPLAAQLTGALSNLTLGPARNHASNAGPGGVNRSQLDDIATKLDQMDVLSCGLDGLLEKLRGGVAPDGISAPPNGAVPSQFVALSAGFLRIVRLRLVDGFGQYLNLCGSDATHPAHPVVVSDALDVTRQNAVVADLIGLPPRFTAPTRIWFRYMSADTPGDEADHETSPVCAFVMPNHLDGALEFFNADGSSAGNLYSRDDGRVHWEDAPGSVTTAGQDPGRVLSNPFAAQFARSLVDWGVADSGRTNEAALAALLRTIDTTLWTIDPYGHTGDEHLSLLMGHPVCVMRAMLRLEVADPVVTPDGTVALVPVELGNLTHWQDGLLGYFVNDDYTVLHTATAAAAMARQCGRQQGFLQQINLVAQHYANFSADLQAGAGATPVDHPYIDSSGRIFVRPNQTVMLTLLVEPLTSVHVTAGLVPRKEIGMRRAWVNDGLAKIAPTFRFGPVLVDPHQIRMPLAAELNGTWVWDYRADAVKWKEDGVTNATDNALLAPDPPTAMEGWLRLTPPPSSGGGTP